MARDKKPEIAREKPVREDILKTIDERIRRFCATQIQSDGGYAPVEPGDVAELHAIFNDIIGARWAQDPDGDLPVSIILTDKTRYERLLNLRIPHTHNFRKREEFDPVIDALASLTGHYADRLETTMKEMRAVDHMNKEKAAAAEARGKKPQGNADA